MSKQDYLSEYAEIAEEVMASEESNVDTGMAASNKDMVAHIQEITKSESFDPMASFDYEGAYTGDNQEMVLVGIYISHIRHEIFNAACSLGLGRVTLNPSLQVHAEYWHRKLWDKFFAMEKGEKVVHTWLH